MKHALIATMTLALAACQQPLIVPEYTGYQGGDTCPYAQSMTPADYNQQLCQRWESDRAAYQASHANNSAAYMARIHAYEIAHPGQEAAPDPKLTAAQRDYIIRRNLVEMCMRRGLAAPAPDCSEFWWAPLH